MAIPVMFQFQVWEGVHDVRKQLVIAVLVHHPIGDLEACQKRKLQPSEDREEFEVSSNRSVPMFHHRALEYSGAPSAVVI